MRDQTRSALTAAAERIGANAYAAQKAAARGRRFRFDPTPEHRRIVAMLNDPSTTDDGAMSYLWREDVMRQRGVL